MRVSIGPVIPGLNDHEIEALLEAARDAGARAAGYVVLRLPREVGPLFRDWLEAHYPDRAKRVMGLVREMHGGRDYDPQWGKRMKGEGVIAELDRPPLRRRDGAARPRPAAAEAAHRPLPRAGRRRRAAFVVLNIRATRGN